MKQLVGSTIIYVIKYIFWEEGRERCLIEEHSQGWIFKISTGTGEMVFLARETNLHKVWSRVRCMIDDSGSGENKASENKEGKENGNLEKARKIREMYKSADTKGLLVSLQECTITKATQILTY